MAGLEGDEKLIKWLNELRDHAIEVNKKWAKRLGIKQSAAISLLREAIGDRKPACATRPAVFIHATARTTCGLYDRGRQGPDHGLPSIDQGVPTSPSCQEGQHHGVPLLVKAPEGAVCVENMDTIAQLNLAKLYQDESCGKPSITVFYTPDTYAPTRLGCGTTATRLVESAYSRMTVAGTNLPHIGEITKEPYRGWRRSSGRNDLERSRWWRTGASNRLTRGFLSTGRSWSRART